MRRSLSWQRPGKRKRTWFQVPLAGQPLVHDAGRAVPGLLPVLHAALCDSGPHDSESLGRPADPTVLKRLRERLESGEAPVGVLGGDGAGVMPLEPHFVFALLGWWLQVLPDAPWVETGAVELDLHLQDTYAELQLHVKLRAVYEIE